MPKVVIAGRKIGKPIFIVAEIGASHNQSLEMAEFLIHGAWSAGADAVKIQLFTPDDLTSPQRDSRFLIKDGLWQGRYLYDLYEEAALPLEWLPRLKEFANHLGIVLFPTIYSINRIALAEELNFSAYKVASYENTEVDLIKALAATGKPLIISTGGLDYFDIVRLKHILHGHPVIWLKCVSDYPTMPEDLNLRSLLQLSRTFGRHVGLSDHSRGIVAPVMATTLGVCMIEKHIGVSGLDSGFALTLSEFGEMVAAIRFAEKAMGGVRFDTERAIERADYCGKRVRVLTK